MTQLTDHAKTILRAIADGKTIEYQDQTTMHWVYADIEDAAKWIADGYPQYLRIAPETRSINGVEFAAPDGTAHDFVLNILGGDDGYTFFFKFAGDRDTAYQAIVDALEGKTK